jgi:hypothetical protein
MYGVFTAPLYLIATRLALVVAGAFGLGVLSALAVRLAAKFRT